LKLFEIFISLQSLYAVVRTICLWGVNPAAHIVWICRSTLWFYSRFRNKDAVYWEDRAI